MVTLMKLLDLGGLKSSTGSPRLVKQLCDNKMDTCCLKMLTSCFQTCQVFYILCVVSALIVSDTDPSPAPFWWRFLGCGSSWTLSWEKVKGSCLSWPNSCSFLLTIFNIILVMYGARSVEIYTDERGLVRWLSAFTKHLLTSLSLSLLIRTYVVEGENQL